jgi:hypothetical protein
MACGSNEDLRRRASPTASVHQDAPVCEPGPILSIRLDFPTSLRKTPQEGSMMCDFVTNIPQVLHVLQTGELGRMS